MKINWFSPLLPAKTAAADYTTGILPALSKAADIILWTDQNEWDASLEKHAEVRPFQPEKISWRELNHADISIYQIGNGPQFFKSICQVSKRHPGIVVLHDFRAAEKNPLRRGALENALGLIVHTQAEADCLKREKRWPLIYVPLPLFDAPQESQHEPVSYVKTVINFVSNTHCFGPHFLAHKLTKKVGAEIGTWTNRQYPEDALRKVAEEIDSIVL